MSDLKAITTTDIFHNNVYGKHITTDNASYANMINAHENQNSMIGMTKILKPYIEYNSIKDPCISQIINEIFYSKEYGATADISIKKALYRDNIMDNMHHTSSYRQRDTGKINEDINTIPVNPSIYEVPIHLAIDKIKYTQSGFRSITGVTRDKIEDVLEDIIEPVEESIIENTYPTLMKINRTSLSSYGTLLQADIFEHNRFLASFNESPASLFTTRFNDIMTKLITSKYASLYLNDNIEAYKYYLYLYVSRGEKMGIFPESKQTIDKYIKTATLTPKKWFDKNVNQLNEFAIQIGIEISTSLNNTTNVSKDKSFLTTLTKNSNDLNIYYNVATIPYLLIHSNHTTSNIETLANILEYSLTFIEPEVKFNLEKRISIAKLISEMLCSGRDSYKGLCYPITGRITNIPNPDKYTRSISISEFVSKIVLSEIQTTNAQKFFEDNKESQKFDDNIFKIMNIITYNEKMPFDNIGTSYSNNNQLLHIHDDRRNTIAQDAAFLLTIPIEKWSTKLQKIITSSLGNDTEPILNTLIDVRFTDIKTFLSFLYAYIHLYNAVLSIRSDRDDSFSPETMLEKHVYNVIMDMLKLFNNYTETLYKVIKTFGLLRSIENKDDLSIEDTVDFALELRNMAHDYITKSTSNDPNRNRVINMHIYNFCRFDLNIADNKQVEAFKDIDKIKECAKLFTEAREKIPISNQCSGSSTYYNSKEDVDINAIMFLPHMSMYGKYNYTDLLFKIAKLDQITKED